MNTYQHHAAVQRERKPVCRNCYGAGYVLSVYCQANEPIESCAEPCDVCTPRAHGPWPDEGMYEPQDITEIAV